MKKIIISSLALAAFGIQSCKKQDSSATVKTLAVHYPTVNIDGSDFYSIKINGALPIIKASAYDSITKEVCTLRTEAAGLDNTVPGLYTVALRGTNADGFYTKRNVYVAVTDIAPTLDLSGEYARTSNGAIANVLKVANGLYSVDNVGGVAASNPAFIIKGYFVMPNDSTIDFPLQPTDAGEMDCLTEKLIMTATDTSYSWAVKNASFGTAVRTFVKQ